MKVSKKTTVLGAFLGLLLTGSAAQAATIEVSSNITTSQTWTADNTYRLKGQIYVRNGATLTIQPGTVIASLPADQGSLAVTSGSRIHVQGTESNPVIMTSTNDTATWVGNDPKTGTWREAANEWGNLTIMGNAVIAESAEPGNTATPTGLNKAPMEGLVAEFAGDENVLYGGDNDDDDSGSVSYLSIRYGGKVIGLDNELNGLSLGGIGRGTDIHHVEIMNNVDDGIEIWGGTVNLKYLSVWNIGDDSIDIDQGWRGKMQFVLVVQGHSLDASQGSGVGDNGFELDGSEDSDAQPVTTGVIYNATFIGQPVDGDGATAWRDNARVQLRNSIFMDAGEAVVRFDNLDGDGSQGYGFNGTLSWLDTWATPYSHSHNPATTINGLGTDDTSTLQARYAAQVDGYLAEITDSVFYNNNHADAYSQADAVGVTASGDSNPAKHNVVANSSPIVDVTRGDPVLKGGKTILPVISLDPRAANDALTSNGTAPADGFFTQAPFRGAFSKDKNWLADWTAAHAFGMTVVNNTSEPAANVDITPTTSFQTENGVVYTVETSTDGLHWSPVMTVVGDGTEKNFTDVTGLTAGKLYRAIVQ